MTTKELVRSAVVIIFTMHYAPFASKRKCQFVRRMSVTLLLAHSGDPKEIFVDEVPKWKNRWVQESATTASSISGAESKAQELPVQFSHRVWTHTYILTYAVTVGAGSPVLTLGYLTVSHSAPALDEQGYVLRCPQCPWASKHSE